MDTAPALRILDALHAFQHQVRLAMRRALEPAYPELTLGEMRVLAHVGRQPGITQRELVEHSNADKAQMARLLARLEEHGWLLRQPDGDDRRVKRLRLSARGRALAARLRAHQEQVARDLLDPLGPAQQTQLLALLDDALLAAGIASVDRGRDV